MEPVRGTEQTAWSRRAVFQLAVRPNVRALRPSAAHNSRRPDGSVFHNDKPSHEPRHRRQATIPSRRRPIDPGQRARPPAAASVSVAQENGQRISCEFACRREPEASRGRIATGYCNRRCSRNQSNPDRPGESCHGLMAGGPDNRPRGGLRGRPQTAVTCASWPASLQSPSAFGRATALAAACSRRSELCWEWSRWSIRSREPARRA